MYTAQISLIKHPNPPTEEDDFLDENDHYWWGDTDELLETPYRNFDFKCDNCHLLSNIAFDLRS